MAPAITCECMSHTHAEKAIWFRFGTPSAWGPKAAVRLSVLHPFDTGPHGRLPPLLLLLALPTAGAWAGVVVTHPSHARWDWATGGCYTHPIPAWHVPMRASNTVCFIWGRGVDNRSACSRQVQSTATTLLLLRR